MRPIITIISAGIFGLVCVRAQAQGLPLSTEPVMPSGGFLPAGPGSSQDQFQRFQQRKEELQRLAPPNSNTQIKAKDKTVNGSSRCVSISNIIVDGAHNLPEDELQRITSHHVHQCLTVSDLNKVIDDLNGAYIAHGYVTSRAYLPQQNLSGGVLKVIVVEGRIASFSFKGVDADLHEEMAFPGLQGEVLDLHDLEQGLEQMNRLPNWQSQMQIAPGPTPGTSIVDVNVPDPGVLHGQIWADNNGQYETGREIGHALLTAQDALGLLDMWSVEYDHSLVGNAGMRRTSYLSANGSIPYGYATFFGGWWMADDAYQLNSQGETFQLYGKRKDFRVGASYVLLRNDIGVTTFQTSYELKSFASYLNQTRIETQSARQASIVSQVSESLNGFGGGVWYITLGMRFGLGGLGTSRSFSDPGPQDPHSRYVKPSLDIDGYQPLDDDIVWHTSVHGEYSTKNQYTSNQLQVGGPYTVRGFF
ncbi:ShlB/FhaC/HecB family hemolysin secretion/activation protein [Entomobacter blattae]|uniref:Hemolysin transporter protein ShlB n=1 Tax=Entomobacter blattae TaxID=2762277 RepID=A0A7H1NNP1_9PROT|nr:ShlB/FhaC/HecB family hemolysin secretion/activation protein [Entomobacter blattae]QNT77401.1 Hemolysin transporter protein ShlB [Entomobacter blattae]